MSFKKRIKSSDEQLSLLPVGPLDLLCESFITSVSEIADGVKREKPLAAAEIFLGDSRDLPTALPQTGYTRVITSPPYPNRMSYIRELRPYMYWLGYLTNGRQAGELDWQAIGGTWGCATSLLGTWQPPVEEVRHAGFAEIIAQIGKRHELLGRYVNKYFCDTRQHLEGLRTVLAPGAKCHYVVGNSKFYDTLLPTEEIYASLFEQAGFVNVRIQTLRKRSSKKELFEFIVHAEMKS